MTKDEIKSIVKECMGSGEASGVDLSPMIERIDNLEAKIKTHDEEIDNFDTVIMAQNEEIENLKTLSHGHKDEVEKPVVEDEDNA